MAKVKMERAQMLTPDEAKDKKQDDRKKKCRYCTNTKETRKFYRSYDFLDTDGRMSVCIDCCTHLFNYFYSIHSRTDIAIYEVCKIMNVRYSSDAYSLLMESIGNKPIGNTVDAIENEEDSSLSIEEVVVDPKTSIFGKYIKMLEKIFNSNEDDMFFDLYSNDRPIGYEDKRTSYSVEDEIKKVYENKFDNLSKKWYPGLSEDDLAFVEGEYNTWAKTKDVDEKGVDILIKELCMHQLYLRNKRMNRENIVKSDIDMLTTLMDKCSLTPDKLKESTSGKSAAAFGSWVKDVETMSPAEWLEDKKMFKDVEGIGDYVDMHFNRALKNYIGMQRDFKMVAQEFDESDGENVYDDIISDDSDANGKTDG